ncbi:MAG: MATE family efflux transporter [Clostridium sp.]|nr:MATE family efflux transporter [Clostridium sp.]
MKKVDLTKGNVISVLIALALPIMGSSLLQFTYNLIDMMWVGKLGSNAVASIGSSSLYINIGNAINAIAVIGTGIKVAHSIGKKDSRAVTEYINSGIIINTTIGILFGLILIVFGDNFIDFLNIKNPIVERDGYYYLIIHAPILIFAFFNMLYTRILGSFGNNKLALKINAVGVILNIVLDPLCIYTFKFGVIGAAVSTLIANIVMFILFRISSNEILSYKRGIPITIEKITEIIRLGFPMALQRVLFTIINIMLAKIVASFGSDAIAAQKVGAQIESVAYMVIGGFNSAVSSFTGQNYGAGEYKRIKKGYNSALIIGITYSIVMAVMFLIFNRQIIKLFINDETTINIAISYLKVVAYSQCFSAVEMISNGLFTGIGMPKIPAKISITFTALRIPLALLLIKPFGINGVWISICVTSIMKGSCAYLIYRMKLDKNL